MALRLVTEHEGRVADVAAVAAVAQVAPVAAVAPSMTASEVATLVSLFQTMLDRTERNILDRLDENSRGANARWTKHDEELDRNREAIAGKFLAMEKRLDDHLVIANAHFTREHDDDLVMQARVRPVQIGVAWAANHWKDIVILSVGVVGLFAVAADIASRYLGGGS